MGTPTKHGLRLKRAGRVPRTRNGGTWTEARYWGYLRAVLRRAFRFWKPGQQALKSAALPYGRQGIKTAYLCPDCGRLFRRQGVQIDHIEAVGALRCLSDLPGFMARLTPEDPQAFMVRCKKCHQAKTNAGRVKG